MKNRLPNPVMYAPKGNKKEDDEIQLDFSPCINCGAGIYMGYYGRYGNGGTCSKSCEAKQAQKPLDFGEPHASLPKKCDIP